MTLRKTNRVVHTPVCVICNRDQPSLHGETFIAIPTSLCENGKWAKLGKQWYFWCGKCFNDLIELYSEKTGDLVKELELRDVDFVNFITPITVFKTKTSNGYNTTIEFENY